MSGSRLERVSFWFDSLDRVPEPEPPRELPAKTDVFIVGAGFTGLWTAYYLKYLQPDLDIAVLEAMTAGFGASGRNGGWCMGTAAGVEDRLANPATRDSGTRVLRSMMATVDEFARICQAENIDCHYAKGGTLAVAYAPFTVRRLQAEAEAYACFDRSKGFGAAGGYVGEGVGASNLAGRIMADLVLERDTDIAHLPWVDDRSERWPPEPLRWLGAKAMTTLGNRADRVELTKGRRSALWGPRFKYVARQVF